MAVGRNKRSALHRCGAAAVHASLSSSPCRIIAVPLCPADAGSSPSICWTGDAVPWPPSDGPYRRVARGDAAHADAPPVYDRRHGGPVKHSLVTRVREWPHSSFHRDVRAELFPEDWAGDVSAEGDFGER